MSPVYEPPGILVERQIAQEPILAEVSAYGAPVAKVWASPHFESLFFATDRVC